MTYSTSIRTRYLRDGLPRRLGGLAANLLRIASLAKQVANQVAVEGLIDESKHFIEWTAGEADVAIAAELVELQVQLARWQRNLAEIWPDPEQRRSLGDKSRAWSERVLDFSGLLD